jgi:uncharacterized surface protein with fasciclin (FAS1) repeats
LAAAAIYLSGCGSDDDTHSDTTAPSMTADMPSDPVPSGPAPGGDEPDGPDEPAAGTIAEVAVEAGTFGTLVEALTAAGLAETFADPDAGPFTVFAPSDDAFAAIDSAALETLVADVPALTAVLQAHVVSGRLDAEAVLGETTLTTLGGYALSVDAEATPPTVGGAAIVATDVAASNGLIHVIGSVIMPEAETPDPALPSIATLATNAGTFTTLLEALTAAGLAETFADPSAGPFTVFAPNDAAFAAIDSAALNAVIEDVEALTAVLQAHVVEGKVDAAQVLAAEEHTTLGGYVLEVDAEASPPTIGGANIIATDLEASNGYVHVIGTVILPSDG